MNFFLFLVIYGKINWGIFYECISYKKGFYDS